MTNRMIRASATAAARAAELPRQPGASVVLLTNDVLASVSGGDTPRTAPPTEVTLNRAKESAQNAAAEDAYLRM